MENRKLNINEPPEMVPTRRPSNPLLAILATLAVIALVLLVLAVVI